MHQLSREANRIQKHLIHHDEIAKNDNKVYDRKSTNVVRKIDVRQE